jgi:hypothetical protein
MRKRDKQDDPKIRWKKKPIMWEQPYWIHLAISHSIDDMHVKKNVCWNLLGTLMSDKRKTKDHAKLQAGLEKWT